MSEQRWSYVMSWKQFEQHVAELCRRDGCTDVVVTGGKDDLGADVIALLPDGRRLVIQCKRQAAHARSPPPTCSSSSGPHDPNTAPTSRCT